MTVEVGEGNPVQSGIYVAYIDNLHVKTAKYAKRMLMMWDNGWFYEMSDQKFRGHVYQWVGPIPALELHD